MNKGRLLISSYFKDRSFVQSVIDSYDDFIENGMQKIIYEEKEVEPTIIPYNLEEYKIRFGKIKMGKPKIVEADGSPREIYPMEARIRGLTYAAPLYLEIIPVINKISQKPVQVVVGELPVMVKSKHCLLYGLDRNELIKLGEDPDDVGGYFIINGSEKVIVNSEDLAPNQFLVTENSSKHEFIGKIFSENGPYRIPLSIEQRKDLIFYVSFTKLKRIPFVVLMKTLGVTSDEEIMNMVLGDSDEGKDDLLINLYEYSSISDSVQAMDVVSKTIGINQPLEVRIKRVTHLIDNFLLPHVGTGPEKRREKAINLAKYLKKFILVKSGKLIVDEKDHYMNKRIKAVGDSLADLFRYNFRILIKDMVYNFQRIVKRGKLPPINTIVRDKLFTSRVYSAMATGSWVADRKGVSQRLLHSNFLENLSYLRKVVSPLSNTQENFAARTLHPTHFGRLDPIETPEGTHVGLRKNLTLLAEVTRTIDDSQVIKILSSLGLRDVESELNKKSEEKTEDAVKAE